MGTVCHFCKSIDRHMRRVRAIYVRRDHTLLNREEQIESVRVFGDKLVACDWLVLGRLGDNSCLHFTLLHPCNCCGGYTIPFPVPDNASMTASLRTNVHASATTIPTVAARFHSFTSQLLGGHIRLLHPCNCCGGYTIPFPVPDNASMTASQPPW
jgi:hypothetical protein